MEFVYDLHIYEREQHGRPRWIIKRWVCNTPLVKGEQVMFSNEGDLGYVKDIYHSQEMVDGQLKASTGASLVMFEPNLPTNESLEARLKDTFKDDFEVRN